MEGHLVMMLRHFIPLGMALALAGCGKMGALDRPAPMWGEAKATSDAAGAPARPLRTIDARDPNADPAPARANQIDGVSGANDAPPQGALDNPYTRPR